MELTSIVWCWLRDGDYLKDPRIQVTVRTQSRLVARVRVATRYPKCARCSVSEISRIRAKLRGRCERCESSGSNLRRIFARNLANALREDFRVDVDQDVQEIGSEMVISVREKNG